MCSIPSRRDGDASSAWMKTSYGMYPSRSYPYLTNTAAAADWDIGSKLKCGRPSSSKYFTGTRSIFSNLSSLGLCFSAFSSIPNDFTELVSFFTGDDAALDAVAVEALLASPGPFAFSFAAAAAAAFGSFARRPAIGFLPTIFVGELVIVGPGSIDREASASAVSAAATAFARTVGTTICGPFHRSKRRMSGWS
eukprot:8635-Pelagococcus_subviridis.AAC.1